MNRLTTVIAFFIIALGIVLAAVVSIQNVTSISLQFLVFRSVEIPLGVLLAFSLALGLILGAVAPFVNPLLRRLASQGDQRWR